MLMYLSAFTLVALLSFFVILFDCIITHLRFIKSNYAYLKSIRILSNKLAIDKCVHNPGAYPA